MKIFKKIKKNIDFFLDLLFPIECIGCQKEDIWLCEECFKKINLNLKNFCPFCGKPARMGCICQQCLSRSPLKNIFIASFYKEELLKKVIHTFKYKYIRDLAKPLGKIIINFLYQSKLNLLFDNSYFLVPISLHRKRLFERGFNQSELLVQIISREFKIPILNNVLKRRRNTKSQTKLKEKERRKNMKNVFICCQPEIIKNKNIILFDDILTTGSTLKEAARVLKKAGAKEIIGLILAKG
ncbi:ComF family protein [Candidatus Kuenenbacteria bacterium HGW-Kuenenbacteria-1]|uniref:ComF family protein n=1 Tax=Candidatus Kuenenbacteria bacterium HGW-Kuenenbacteria-1 TaxID=2013812 RepID=A0A2N1UMU1_9BACT|nr:MAG: ComF family protein [Candidatus Kuenenbacteria bacterium HGW-Kuenenbacteria-1]